MSRQEGSPSGSNTVVTSSSSMQLFRSRPHRFRPRPAAPFSAGIYYCVAICSHGTLDSGMIPQLARYRRFILWIGRQFRQTISLNHGITDSRSIVRGRMHAAYRNTVRQRSISQVLPNRFQFLQLQIALIPVRHAALFRPGFQMKLFRLSLAIATMSLFSPAFRLVISSSHGWQRLY